jgi:hypothetical protein
MTIVFNYHNFKGEKLKRIETSPAMGSLFDPKNYKRFHPHLDFLIKNDWGQPGSTVG